MQVSKPKPRFFYGYIVAIAACFITMVCSGTYFSFGVFFKPMLGYFGWTSAMTSVAISVSWIVQGFMGIVMGKLNDRFGPRFVLTICGFLVGLGYLLTSQTDTIWQLYLFYGLIIGTGISGVVVPLLSTTARWFTNRRSVMTGIVMSGGGIGTLVAPPIISRLISAYDWRTAYIVLGIVTLVLVVPAAQFLKRDSSQGGQRPYDENGAREEKPELPVKAFSVIEAVSTRQFWVTISLLFSLGYCAQTIVVHIVPHAIELGIPMLSAANYLATLGGITIFGTILLGGVADRIGNRQTYIIALVLMSASLLWLIPATDAWMLYVFVAVFGIPRGAGVLTSPLVAELFGLSSHGLIFGTVAFSFTIGAAIGPFLSGLIFDITSSYQLAFTVCAAMAIIGIVSASLLKPVKAR